MADEQQAQQIPACEIPRAVFEEVDSDKDGKISQEEVVAALKKLGKDLSEEEIARLFKEADKDQDGKVDFEEISACFPQPAPIQA